VVPRLAAHPLVESSRLPPAALPRLEDCILTSTLGPKAPKNHEKEYSTDKKDKDKDQNPLRDAPT
jgi:hypothetical protein